MEFKLNKIDTDIRKKMQEERKSGKVHSSKNINVNKDLQDGKGNAYYGDNKQQDNRKKRFITIDSIKYCNEGINVEVERTENIDILNSKGQILDTKK